jgi:serine/threonine-protein kinase
VLPQARGVLFTATVAGGAIGSLRVLPKGGGAPKTLVENAPYGRYLDGGYLVYYQDGKLFAAPFNLDRLEISGPASLVVGHVAADTVRGAIFEASLSGTVIYRRGDEETSRVVSWMESSGAVRQLAAKPSAYLTPRLSPDGKRLALAVAQGGEQNLWIYELANDTMKRLTFDPETQLLPVWTPDGEFVAFRSGSSLAWARSDGSGKLEHLESASLNPLPCSFSPDGKWLAFAGDDPDTGLDLYVAPVERTAGAMRLGTPKALLRQPGGQYAPAISPDGRWVAYSSDESGRAELYVTEFSPDGMAGKGKWQVSGEGGIYAAWAGSGRQLFYRSADRHIMVETYTTKGDSFLAGKPRPWTGRRLAVAGGFASFDVALDGGGVAGIFESPDNSAERDLRILLNASGELRRRAARR